MPRRVESQSITPVVAPLAVNLRCHFRLAATVLEDARRLRRGDNRTMLRDMICVRVRDNATLARPVGVEPQVYIGQVQSFLVFNSQQSYRPLVERVGVGEI
jgi:hypothetical protein